MPDLGEARSRIVLFFKRTPFVWDLLFISVLLVGCCCAVASWNCYRKPAYLFSEPLSGSDLKKAEEFLQSRGAVYKEIDGGYIAVANPVFSRNLRREMIRLGITPHAAEYQTFDYRNHREGGE